MEYSDNHFSGAPPMGVNNVKVPSETVAIVITTCNDPAFLREAVESAIAQRHPPDEILVVDDGSTESPAPILAGLPHVTLIRKPNGGLSSARNCGLHNARSQYVLFLDADDRLRPDAVSSGLACFRSNLEAVMVYGGHRRIAANGAPLGLDNYEAIGKDAYAHLLTGNCIGMHATVLYRREILLTLDGFDTALPRCEDYDLYLRLTARYPIASHPDIIAEYRWHGKNMSADTGKMLESELAVHNRHRIQPPHRRKAWRVGQRNWKAWYKVQGKKWGEPETGASTSGVLPAMAPSVITRFKLVLHGSAIHRLAAKFGLAWPPPVGAIDFGHFGTPRPISQDFGWDRGTPVDRYYVTKFLAASAQEIAGRVLEIGDDEYSRTFGGSKITHQDVLHLDLANPKATLTGDLTRAGVLPRDTFDCIILTQTLQLIFHLDQAIASLHSALKSGGVLLLTVPGISQVDRGEWGSNWCWSFTGASIRQLFEPRFGTDHMTIQSFGNVFAATTFLQGLSLEEINQSNLEQHDPAYPVIVTLRARKL